MNSLTGFLIFILLSGGLASCSVAPDVTNLRGAKESTAKGNAFAATSAPLVSLSVTTQKGVVTGKASGSTRAFLGVPFAKPPTGARRWKAPEEMDSWTGSRQTTALPKPCLQPGPLGTSPLSGSSEDCLYLNVWTPQAEFSQPLPVMVFIHGGGLLFGHTSEKYYDGEQLATRGQVVVVTLQYRLGNLGFLAHPALRKESTYDGSGNYGFMDQMAGLAWVRANIKAFGGDPTNVTLFGESGGGTSVCHLLASAKAQPLFDKAIIESQNCPTRPVATAEAIGKKFSKALGCGDSDAASVASCMRSKGNAAMVTVAALDLLDETNFGQSQYLPNLDNDVVAEDPYERLASGAVKKPTMTGFNGVEGLFFVPFVYTATEVKDQLKTRLGETAAQKVLERYPAASFANPTKQGEQILADHLFYCPSRQVTRHLSEGGAPVYKYLFNHTSQSGSSPTAPHHAAELPYVFQNLKKMHDAPASVDLQVERQFLGYWTNFARTGDPNGTGLVAWKKHDATLDDYLELTAQTKPGRAWHKAECDAYDQYVWETLNPN